mgnify:CR=1 FL=1
MLDSCPYRVLIQKFFSYSHDGSLLVTQKCKKYLKMKVMSVIFSRIVNFQYTITCPFHLIPAYEVLIIVFADNYCSINNNVNVLMCMMFSLLPSLCACRSRTSPESSCIIAENDGASAEVFCEIVRLKYGCGRLCR